MNRRLLVDSTAEHAKAIRRALLDPQAIGIDGDAALVMRAVAGRLRALAADRNADPLEVIRLRGGVQSRVPTDPSRPAVLLSTLPMFGSRLLFRGYGSSRSMRPIDAALSGTDSLVLVDEAHLAKHLIRLIPGLTECTRSARPILGGTRSRPQVVALTATGDASARDRFDLDADDEADPIVRQRLDASKSMRVRSVARDVVKGMVQETRLLLKQAARPATCIVFANTPKTARAVYDELTSTRGKGFDHPSDIVLLTGRMREREAERTRERVLDRVHGMPAARDLGALRERHLIVVATQTLEVGADIDAEYLVTETCGVRALTQRLGRLNRLGRFKHAKAVYVHAPARKRKGQPAGAAPEWPVYGTEPAKVLARLEKAMDGGALSKCPTYCCHSAWRARGRPRPRPRDLTGSSLGMGEDHHATRRRSAGRVVLLGHFRCRLRCVSDLARACSGIGRTAVAPAERPGGHRRADPRGAAKRWRATVSYEGSPLTVSPSRLWRRARFVPAMSLCWPSTEDFSMNSGGIRIRHSRSSTCPSTHTACPCMLRR